MGSVTSKNLNLKKLQNLVLKLLMDNYSWPSDLFKKNAEERLEVYRRSIVGIHTKTLQTTYPVCYKLVGEEFFNTLARVYIKQNPSNFRNLYEYGETFPEFIGQFPPARCLPYLACVANLEWAWLKAFYGPDYENWDPQDLLKVSEDFYPRIIFHLPKNSSLLTSSYPIHRIWEMNQEDQTSSESLNIDDDSAKLFVWRKERKVVIQPLHDEQWDLLLNISQNKTLAELCTHLSALQDVVRNGWIEGFSIL